MQTNYATSRLVLEPLSEKFTAFILELLNTQGWITFIGERNIRSEADALVYIKKILGNPDVTYRVVHIKDTGEPIGVITLIQRTYLDHRDIGFAFLPQFAGKGYAYEAAKAVLDDLLQDPVHSQILAATIPENAASIKLLVKLGLKFEKLIVVENEPLNLYSIRPDF